MVGQVDCLEVKENIKHWKFSRLDLSPILYKEPALPFTGLYHMEDQDHGLESVLDWELVKTAQPALQRKEKVEAEFKIRNTDRTVGTILSNEITKIYKGEGLPDETPAFQVQWNRRSKFRCIQHPRCYT
jgi:glutamate synthase (NADPH/NADH) large chain